MSTGYQAWEALTDGFSTYQSQLFNNFFSSLSSTTASTSAEFFTACDANFTPMLGPDLLPIPGPATLESPCDVYQDMVDLRSDLEDL